MTMKVAIALLLLISLTSAVLEGLWGAIPPVFVQFNGLVLLLSALVLLGVGASGILRRSA